MSTKQQTIDTTAEPVAADDTLPLCPITGPSEAGGLNPTYRPPVMRWNRFEVFAAEADAARELVTGKGWKVT